MALLYRAELSPSKLELVTAWLPAQPWYSGPDAPDLQQLAFFRLDDPDGEVGIETLLIRDGDGPLMQVPLTYRNAPLDGHDRWLVGTMEHSVLGRRWAYDACGDPVYVDVLANTILTGGSQAEEFVDTDGIPVRREPTMTVRGSGTATERISVGDLVRVDDEDPTIIVTHSVELTVRRIVDRPATGSGEHLTAVCPGRDPVTVAYARPIG